MVSSAELMRFLDAIREDARIGPVHVSLFVAIWQHWSRNNYQNPVCILPGNLMQQSKISGRNTYYRSIKQLHQYGYIQYKPSHNGFNGSFISVNPISCELRS